MKINETKMKQAQEEALKILQETEDKPQAIVDAMEKTVGYILKQYPQVSNSLTGSIAKWLTDDENIVKQKDGYFRGTPREIRVRGAVYWLGTSSNTTVKVHQMQRLCNLANVNRNEIIWYQESAGRQVFSW